jgi:hypothetical protein
MSRHTSSGFAGFTVKADVIRDTAHCGNAECDVLV